jgi:hypothetical protein
MNKLVVIAGSGRSGTTWVQDCIAEANNLRTIFEPLHPIGVPRAGKFSFKYRESAAADPDLKAFMGRVLSGSYRSLWMNYRIRPDRFNFFRTGIPNAVHNARKLAGNYKKYHGQSKRGLVVKFIRANLMLPWIIDQFGVDALLVTRHPCAVIASILKLGGKDWTSQLALDRYRADPKITQLILEQFDIDINEKCTLVEALACAWCIENILPARWANKTGYSVVAYEKLLLDPEYEWNRVISKIGLDAIPGNQALSQPSQQAPEDMRGVEYSSNHAGKWRQKLTEDQINQIATVLKRFSCEIYSVESDFPLVEL